MSNVNINSPLTFCLDPRFIIAGCPSSDGSFSTTTGDWSKMVNMYNGVSMGFVFFSLCALLGAFLKGLNNRNWRLISTSAGNKKVTIFNIFSNLILSDLIFLFNIFFIFPSFIIRINLISNDNSLNNLPNLTSLQSYLFFDRLPYCTLISSYISISFLFQKLTNKFMHAKNRSREALFLSFFVLFIITIIESILYYNNFDNNTVHIDDRHMSIAWSVIICFSFVCSSLFLYQNILSFETMANETLQHGTNSVSTSSKPSSPSSNNTKNNHLQSILDRFRLIKMYIYLAPLIGIVLILRECLFETIHSDYNWGPWIQFLFMFFEQCFPHFLIGNLCIISESSKDFGSGGKKSYMAQIYLNYYKELQDIRKNKYEKSSNSIEPLDMSKVAGSNGGEANIINSPRSGAPSTANSNNPNSPINNESVEIDDAYVEKPLVDKSGREIAIKRFDFSPEDINEFEMKNQEEITNFWFNKEKGFSWDEITKWPDPINSINERLMYAWGVIVVSLALIIDNFVSSSAGIALYVWLAFSATNRFLFFSRFDIQQYLLSKYVIPFVKKYNLMEDKLGPGTVRRLSSITVIMVYWMCVIFRLSVPTVPKIFIFIYWFLSSGSLLAVFYDFCPGCAQFWLYAYLGKVPKIILDKCHLEYIKILHNKTNIETSTQTQYLSNNQQQDNGNGNGNGDMGTVIQNAEP